MSQRLWIVLPEGLRYGLEALAERLGKTKGEIVRDALIAAGATLPGSAEGRAEARRRAAEFRQRQSEPVDTAALAREAREELEGREQASIAAGGERPCAARHEPRRRSRVTPGFQRTPLA